MRSRRARSSARLSTLEHRASRASPASTVSPSGRLKLASSTPTNARSSASVGGSIGVARPDERPADLAEPLVRHAEHRRARDLRMACEHVLHLRRIDVVAAADEHLALAAAEVQIALRRRASRGRRCGSSPPRRSICAVASGSASSRASSPASGSTTVPTSPGGQRTVAPRRRRASSTPGGRLADRRRQDRRSDRRRATPSRCRPRSTSSGRRPSRRASPARGG